MAKKYSLTELVEKDILQQLQDIFISRSGIATGISDAEGNAVTEATEKLSAFCELYTKQTEVGCERCRQCDVNNAKIAARSGHVSAYRCHTGLIDFTAPIVLNGELLGFIIGGQVSTEPLDEDSIKTLAICMGIDPELYWTAAQRVKIVDKYKMNEILNLADSISNLIGDMARTKYQLLEASAEVEAAARMKSDFLANMSHEIRTPMNAVIGMADMALREELPPIARSYINQIKSSGKSLLAIINDILDFSKIDAGKMDILSFDYHPYEILAEVANIINTRIGSKDIEFMLDISNKVPSTLVGDANRIKQIIINIANNAVKFTQKGYVKLSMECEVKSSTEAVIQIAVMDSGIGIKEEDMNKLFSSFQQVDSKRNRNVEGTGLGLAITKNLLDLMGGSISVSSEYGTGSCFTITIPQGIKEDYHVRTIEHASDIKPVVIVRNDYVRDQLEKDLERFGIKCAFASGLSELGNYPDTNYLFVDNSCDETELKSLVSANDRLKVAEILGFRDEIRLAEEKIIPIRKPVYNHNLYRLFNNMEIVEAVSSDEEEVSKFTAPNAKILVVDDNAVNLTVAKGLLKPLNMHVDTADSGKKCLEMIENEAYDIIFMDHMMPEMDGVETTRMIRRMYPKYDNKPVIALTANALEEARKMFMEEGMSDFIAKPIEATKMYQMVRKWLPKEFIVEDNGNATNDAQTVSAEAVVAGGESATADPVTNPMGYLKKAGLDIDKALGMLGSEDVYKDVAQIYYGMIKEKDQTILDAWEQQDWSTFTIEVHAVKSSSRQLGAMELGDIAEQLEMAGKSQDVETVQNNINKLFELRQDVYSVFEDIFGGSDESEGTKEVNMDEVVALFDAMLAASDDLDIGAMETAMNELCEYKFVEPEKSKIAELKKAVDGMDFEEVENIVNDWKNNIA